MFKSKFEALRLRRGHKRAIFAIAHKILETVFLLIRRQTHYWDSSVDLEALSLARNAPRWLRMLKKKAGRCPRCLTEFALFCIAWH